MAEKLDRHNFDSAWLVPAATREKYTKFHHRPVEECGARARIKRHITDAVVDHHIVPEALAGALARRGFTKAKAILLERLPTESRTRTGNFGDSVGRRSNRIA